MITKRHKYKIKNTDMRHHNGTARRYNYGDKDYHTIRLMRFRGMTCSLDRAKEISSAFTDPLKG